MTTKVDITIIEWKPRYLRCQLSVCLLQTVFNILAYCILKLIYILKLMKRILCEGVARPDTDAAWRTRKCNSTGSHPTT
jgi:hypothetical protein